MNKRLYSGEQELAYTLRKSRRAKRVRLVVYCDGSVVVTTPITFHESRVEQFLGEKSEWLFKKIAAFKRFEGVSIGHSGKREYQRYREVARELVLSRLAYFNDHYQVSYGRVSIRNQKTRWGSCSRRGNLSFNYKIIHLPPHLADYIIVHELCHLREFNHSPQFWKLVAETIPKYEEYRRTLRYTREQRT